MPRAHLPPVPGSTDGSRATTPDEGASRVGYPPALLNVSTPARLEHALCSIASREERACLQRAALRGAMLTGPQHSSLELIAGACKLAEICEKPIPGAVRVH